MDTDLRADALRALAGGDKARFLELCGQRLTDTEENPLFDTALEELGKSPGGRGAEVIEERLKNLRDPVRRAKMEEALISLRSR
jgi:hypothetical protein